MDRPAAGTYPDYHYSDANKNSGIIWDEATLKEYLRDPKAKVPGTKMVFPGLKSDEDIANVHRLPQAVRPRWQENLIAATLDRLQVGPDEPACSLGCRPRPRP